MGIMNSIDVTINTKAGRIAETIAKDISQGRYAPGMLLPTERELARSYDVSPATMRKSLRLLSEIGQVVKHPQRGVVVPGSSIQARKVEQIAFITPCPNDGTNEWARGISSCLDPEHFTLAVYSAYHEMKKMGQVVENVLATRPAGIIISPMPDEQCHIDGDILTKSGIPVVTIGHATIPGLSCDRIDESGLYSGRMLAKFVLKYRFRNIAYFTCGPRYTSDDTINSLRQELTSSGFELPEEKIYIYDAPHGVMSPPDPYIDARRQMAKMLGEGFKCELLIAGHDYPAVGALQALTAAGVKVPQQMKIISAMRCPVEGITPMKLTTIDFNRISEGKIATELLMRRINGYGGPIEVHHVSLDLIEGETA